MSPMRFPRFPRVTIIKDGQVIEYGYLNKDMPQSDGTYLYEIYGDSARLYIVKDNEFYYSGESDFYSGESDESKRQG